MSEMELEQEQEPEETSREALETAFEEHSEPEVLETEVAETEAPEGELATEAPEETGVEGEAPPVEASTDNAPQSWSPAAREEWINVPDSVKEVIAKREQEMQGVMQESAQARQFSQQFGEQMGQYQGLFNSQGVDAMGGIDAIMQTAAPLYGGTPQQKAEAVAGIIQQFGIDIATLDGLLVGEQPAPVDPGMQALQDQINNMGQYIQNQQHGQQQQQVAQQQETSNEVEKFVAENEFAADLRGVMADFMGMAGQQGQQLSLVDAYQRAIATRPDIQQIIANRAQGQHNEQQLGKARTAATSIPQTSGINQAAPIAQTSREAIENAWNES